MMSSSQKLGLVASSLAKKPCRVMTVAFVCLHLFQFHTTAHTWLRACVVGRSDMSFHSHHDAVTITIAVAAPTTPKLDAAFDVLVGGRTTTVIFCLNTVPQ